MIAWYKLNHHIKYIGHLNLCKIAVNGKQQNGFHGLYIIIFRVWKIFWVVTFWNSFSKIVRRFDYVPSENACRIKSVPCSPSFAWHSRLQVWWSYLEIHFFRLESRELSQIVYEIHVFEPTGLDSCYIDLDLDSPDFLKAFLWQARSIKTIKHIYETIKCFRKLYAFFGINFIC